MNKRAINWLTFFLVVGVFGYWIYKVATKSLPGEAVADQGRDHVTDIAGINYSSNPPTSGSHFPVWAKSGVYDRLISDGYLIHSLEHGYIVISYDCSKLVPSAYNLVPVALAHDEPTEKSTDSGELLKHMRITPQGDMNWFTSQNPPEVEVGLPDSFQSQSCKDLVTKLSEFTKVAERVIIVPRVGMDTPIALTAWNRILKLNSLDQKAITDFIKTFHNRGPEQTEE